MKILRVNHNNAAEAVAANAGYCPCKLFKNDDTKCMCKQFREQIAQQKPGECECGLYQLITDPKPIFTSVEDIMDDRDQIMKDHNLFTDAINDHFNKADWDF